MRKRGIREFIIIGAIMSFISVTISSVAMLLFAAFSARFLL